MSAKKKINHAEVYFNIQHIILLRQPDSKLSVGCCVCIFMSRKCKSVILKVDHS